MADASSGDGNGTKYLYKIPREDMNVLMSIQQGHTGQNRLGW